MTDITIKCRKRKEYTTVNKTRSLKRFLAVSCFRIQNFLTVRMTELNLVTKHYLQINVTIPLSYYSLVTGADIWYNLY